MIQLSVPITVADFEALARDRIEPEAPFAKRHSLT